MPGPRCWRGWLARGCETCSSPSLETDLGRCALGLLLCALGGAAGQRAVSSGRFEV